VLDVGGPHPAVDADRLVLGRIEVKAHRGRV
jgi:hypothetical protein